MLDKYNPVEIESKHYQNWGGQGYFQPSMDLTRPSFSIQLLPPSVADTLHMGHAFGQTIMDGLTRYYRMKGYNTTWIPGTDHAGVAIQTMVERQLTAQNVSRHDLGRERFLEKVWEWKKVSGDTITQQMHRVGCSADWTHGYFTMDDMRAETVAEVFVCLYEQGLIYRGKRLMDWDPVLGTAVLDLKVESVEEQGSTWHTRYPLADNPVGATIVTTTRPETLLDDVATTVDPEDERYTRLVGKELILSLTGRTVPVTVDRYVGKDFGTGRVKITPANDFNDYEVGRRRDTCLVNVFDLGAKVLASAEVFNFKGGVRQGFALPEKYTGLERFAVRKQMIADLQEQGFLVEIESRTLMTPKGDRTGPVIEPMLTNQWSVIMSATPNGDEPDDEFKGLSLADKTKKAVDNGVVHFAPGNWVNTYNQWMNNIQDWCISRQLRWGRQIPMWYDETGNVYVVRSRAEAERQAGRTDLTREGDVLDTWFSSALVLFSTLGWPSETDELEAFLPSNVLVTGYEIISFWVARTIMMTAHFTGKVSFEGVYIHDIVRDHEGKKMSKSESDIIDPVDLISGTDLDRLLVKRTVGLRKPEAAPKVEEAAKRLFPEDTPSMGVDTLRFTMVSYASLGRSVNFDFKRAESCRNFCNRLWNATNFVLANAKDENCGQGEMQPLAFIFADQWIISKLRQAEAVVTEAFETYRFDLAAQTLYESVWGEYCDWYIELAKVQIQAGCSATQHATHRILVRVLETILCLLHPIMPSIAKELWQVVVPLADTRTADSIMLATYPQADKEQIIQTAFDKMAALEDLVEEVRKLRDEMSITPNVKAPLFAEGSAEPESLLKYLSSLTRLTEVKLVDNLPEMEDAPIAVCNSTRPMLKVEINKAAEAARLSKGAEKLQKALDKLDTKLSKPGYTEKTLAHLTGKDKADLTELKDKMAKVQTQLTRLKD